MKKNALLVVSHFNHVATTLPTVEEIAWDAFTEKFKQHLELPSKELAPVISPAEWPTGSRRSGKSVLRVHFAALDLDKISDELLAGVQEVLAPYRYFIHTTYSHANMRASSGLNCLRVYLPLTRPVEIAEWRIFWRNLNALLGGALDPACKDAGRVYFVPSMPIGAREKNYTNVKDGKVLDVNFLLSSPPVAQSQQLLTRSSLVDFAKSLCSRPDPYKKEMGSLLLKVANGEVFAEPGARDATLFKICAQLAEKWPKADPLQMASLFEAGIRKMSEVSDDAPTIDDVVEKLKRRQESQPPVPTCEVNRDDILDAFGGKRDYPYSEEELESFAEGAGVPRSRFIKRWIIRRGESCYLFLDGKYGSPVSLNELVDAATIDLSPACTAGVELYRYTSKGARVAKSEKELLADYSTLARQTLADLAVEKTTYDWTQKILMESPCPLRDLEPTYSENVHQYLTLLGGNSSEKLLDWVSLVTQLKRPCSALFLYGAPGTGKSLLGLGLTRLWTLGAATELKSVLKDFNASLSKSPLVVADEKVPGIAQKEGGSADLRNLIQQYARPLNRKFKDEDSLLGSLRLLIATNNKSVLAWKESLNNDDIEAIRDRFLAINVGRESAAFLRDLGDARETFVFGDEIAKHALWLRDNREVDTSTRFLVQGVDPSFHESLVSNSVMGSAVLHWLTCYLQNPTKMDAKGNEFVRIHEGQLLVTARALVEDWEMYTTNMDTRIANVHKISAALSSISEPKKKQLLDGKNVRTNYWRVETKYLLNWIQETGYASEEEILNALSPNGVRKQEPGVNIFGGAQS
jgi:hypothetical protein